LQFPLPSNDHFGNAARTVKPYAHLNWAAVVPVANEEPEWHLFQQAFVEQLDALGSGQVYLVVDTVSKDRTRALCDELSAQDARFVTLWRPTNRHLVEAYLAGFRAALEAGHELIIEMDAGLSHDPRAIPMFLRVLSEGNECAFGSRYINGGSMVDSPWKRRFFSKGGSWLARLLLGGRLNIIKKGYEGFHRNVLMRLVNHPLRSTAHFYQTEVRYLLRKTRWMEVPIHYRAPSPRVSKNAIRNSIATLLHYAIRRLTGHSSSI